MPRILEDICGHSKLGSIFFWSCKCVLVHSVQTRFCSPVIFRLWLLLQR